MKIQNMYLFFILFIACNNNENNAIRDVNKIKNLEVRAITLREKRFRLADQIRYIEDSLLHKNNLTDTLNLKQKLDAIKIEKEKILSKTYSLADSIKIEIDNSMEKRISDLNYKKAFDKKMREINKFSN